METGLNGLTSGPTDPAAPRCPGGPGGPGTGAGVGATGCESAHLELKLSGISRSGGHVTNGRDDGDDDDVLSAHANAVDRPHYC